MAETAETAAAAAPSLDLIGQFMVTLSETMSRLAIMYRDCPRTTAHVAEFLRHTGEERTRQRSVKMWHKAMQPHYVAIAQTKDAARRERAMLEALRGNWFFAQMGMAEKWADPAFDPSRERFLEAVRVLNGLAFMQHSFLGKLSEAMQGITAKLAARGGGLESLDAESMMDLLPELMGLVNQDTLQEINRMLPHVVYVIGGKDKLMGMLDQAVGETGAMKGVIAELLGAFIPAAGAAGAEGAGADGEAASPFAGAAAEAAASPEAFIDRGISTVRDIFEKIADPDNENSLAEVLESFGMGPPPAASGDDEDEAAGPPPAMDADAIRTAFEEITEQFGEGSGGALGAIGSVLREHLSGGGGGSGEEGGGFGLGAEELTSLAAEALRVRGIDVDESQLEAVRRLTGAFSRMAAGGGADSGSGSGSGAEGPEEGAEGPEPAAE
jgi:hypothetical protein